MFTAKPRGKKLYKGNLLEEYPNLGEGKEVTIKYKKALLQKNYGLDYDCTLTSMAFMFGEEHYDAIEEIAKKLGYKGEKRGTNPLVIKTLMQRVMKTIGVKGTCKGVYGKGVGFTWKRVKDLIEKDHYIILSMANDGRNYYKNHSVTIVGYAEYKKHRFLVVYDNWNVSYCYIDFDKLNVISSINWYE